MSLFARRALIARQEAAARAKVSTVPAVEPAVEVPSAPKAPKSTAARA